MTIRTQFIPKDYCVRAACAEEIINLPWDPRLDTLGNHMAAAEALARTQRRTLGGCFRCPGGFMFTTNEQKQTA